VNKALNLLCGIFGIFLVVASVGCQPGAESADKAATEQRMVEMRSQVGLPAIVNFTEAKFAKMMAELRDQNIKTWAYYLDVNGGRHLLCEAVGYGLPYSVQLTNPEKYEVNGTTLPQAEPNGLYMPESADATWVLCSDGKGGVAPVYSEPLLIVSPFPLGHVDAAESSGFADKVTIQKLPLTPEAQP
jgi:hypothetical protein